MCSSCCSSYSSGTHQPRLRAHSAVLAAAGRAVSQPYQPVCGVYTLVEAQTSCIWLQQLNQLVSHRSLSRRERDSSVTCDSCNNVITILPSGQLMRQDAVCTRNGETYSPCQLCARRMSATKAPRRTALVCKDRPSGWQAIGENAKRHS